MCVHITVCNIAQNSSDNLLILRTITIAQMLSIGGEGRGSLNKHIRASNRGGVTTLKGVFLFCTTSKMLTHIYDQITI